jgi:excisionase family DNA binding protein
MSIPSTGLGDAERGAGLLDSPRWVEHNVFTIEETAEILRISKWSAYEAAKRKQIPTIKVGRRKFIPRRALERMLEGEDR